MKTIEKKVVKSTRQANRKANRMTKRITPDGVIELKEGVTGKQFTQAKRDTNNEVKKQRSNISQCIAEAMEHDKGYFASFNKSKTQLKKLIRPSEIIQHATDYELTLFAGSLAKLGYVKFNVWGTLTMIKRHVDKKKVNKNAVDFFSGDTATVKRAITRATKAVAKAKAEREAREQAK
jgi:hypothetical protein